MTDPENQNVKKSKKVCVFSTSFKLVKHILVFSWYGLYLLKYLNSNSFLEEETKREREGKKCNAFLSSPIHPISLSLFKTVILFWESYTFKRH